MKDNRKYLIAVTLLIVLAVVFGLAGTVAPPLEEEAKLSESSSSSSSSSSVAHFANPPTYDSGWVDIQGKTGQYVSLKHNLNTTDVVVDITGKQSLDPMGGALAWSRNYGVDGRPQEVYSIVQTSDGGYALAGHNMTLGIMTDFCLVKVDSAGNLQWSKNYGVAGETERARSLVQTSDGGYALAGYNISVGNDDFCLVKVDSAGNLQWSKNYGADDELAFSLVLDTFDDGYALAGYNSTGGYDFCLVKVDSSGNLQWSKNYGDGAAPEWAFSLVQTGDAGYALAGYNTSAGNADFCLVKVDSSGNLQWSKNYGGAGDEVAYSLVLDTFDDGYALAGYNSTDGYDFCLVKVDSSGNLQWSKNYGGAGDEVGDAPNSLVQTFDGGYALAGYNISAGYYDFCLVKVDSSGNLQWSRNYGGADHELAYSLVQTSDGGYALAGYTSSYGDVYPDFWLVKVMPEVNLEHQRNLGTETGLTCTAITNTTIILYRGTTDAYWNYVHVRIWLIKEPTWIYGDINMDGVVDAQDLYILSRNYGKTFSALSLGGIAAVAGVHTYKKRKRNN